jgi:hypothetical protein
MPRISYFPLILDECLTLNVSSFKGLKPGHITNGVITWYRGNTKRGSVDFFVYALGTGAGQAALQLDYTYEGKPIQVKIELICTRSNLGEGKGLIWFFKCPVTGRKCRKLHLVDGRFVHRTALVGAFYEIQTYSHKTVILKRMFDACFVPYSNNKEMERRYFKPTYKGKNTRSHERLLRQEERTRRFTLEQIGSVFP